MLRRFRTVGVRLFAKFRRDDSGLALLEFALTVPLVLTLGVYGVEMTNLALVNMRVSQFTMDLADNAARMGDEAALSSYTIDEANINDQMQGIRLEGKGINLTTYGRITMSSLEGVSTNNGQNSGQLLHWQRCIGLKSGTGWDSSYGSAGSGTSGTYVASAGMGDTGSQVAAPQGSGVMFVEVNYLYQPLFGGMFLSPRRLHYVSSYIVRDSARSYASGVTNTNSQTVSSCSTTMS